MHCVALRCVTLRCVGLGWVGLGCVVLCCVVLCCVVLFCVVLYCVVLRCVVCVVLYCVVVSCIVLLIYYYVDIIKYNAMHKFLGVLDNPPQQWPHFSCPFLLVQLLYKDHPFTIAKSTTLVPAAKIASRLQPVNQRLTMLCKEKHFFLF